MVAHVLFQNFSGDLPPAHYNVLSQRRVQQRFGFDIVAAINEHETFDQAVAFFEWCRAGRDPPNPAFRLFSSFVRAANVIGPRTGGS